MNHEIEGSKTMNSTGSVGMITQTQILIEELRALPESFAHDELAYLALA
jgi:hypothetical protein